ncbi:Histone-Lysine N-Methyltransferase ash1l [Phlyctochytrium planicorne]|nr:Histone-Lysine N-Methyltransferase ash1l [Phlyctochytrium planicorne]
MGEATVSDGAEKDAECSVRTNGHHEPMSEDEKAADVSKSDQLTMEPAGSRQKSERVAFVEEHPEPTEADEPSIDTYSLKPPPKTPLRNRRETLTVNADVSACTPYSKTRHAQTETPTMVMSEYDCNVPDIGLPLGVLTSRNPKNFISPIFEAPLYWSFDSIQEMYKPTLTLPAFSSSMETRANAGSGVPAIQNPATNPSSLHQIRTFFKSDVPTHFLSIPNRANEADPEFDDTPMVFQLGLATGMNVSECILETCDLSVTSSVERLKTHPKFLHYCRFRRAWAMRKEWAPVPFSQRRKSMGRPLSTKNAEVKTPSGVRKPPSERKTHKKQAPKPIGARAAEAEESWVSHPEMKDLYAKKSYLKAGLYSVEFRTGEAVVVEGQRPKFKMEMPMYYGNTLLNTEEEFELPYDFVKLMELRNFIPLVSDNAKRKPSPFIRIKKNIFVGRKPRKPIEVARCICPTPDEPGAPACGEECLNRCMFIECTPGFCPAGDACTNQSFQKSDSNENLEVFWTQSRGYGLRATKVIPKNSLVIEYRGEIVSQAECIERMNTIYKDIQNYYFLNYAEGEVIDGCRRGTEARFVNHSCEPNCHIEKWSVMGEFCVGLFASADIQPGSELTYDYRFESFGPMQRCLCGSPNCRGFIGVNKKKENKDAKPPSKKILKKKKTKRTKKSNAAAAAISDEESDDEYVWHARSHEGLEARKAKPVNEEEILKRWNRQSYMRKNLAKAVLFRGSSAMGKFVKRRELEDLVKMLQEKIEEQEVRIDLPNRRLRAHNEGDEDDDMDEDELDPTDDEAPPARPNLPAAENLSGSAKKSKPAFVSLNLAVDETTDPNDAPSDYCPSSGPSSPVKSTRGSTRNGSDPLPNSLLRVTAVKKRFDSPQKVAGRKRKVEVLEPIGEDEEKENVRNVGMTDSDIEGEVDEGNAARYPKRARMGR